MNDLKESSYILHLKSKYMINVVQHASHVNEASANYYEIGFVIWEMQLLAFFTESQMINMELQPAAC